TLILSGDQRRRFGQACGRTNDSSMMSRRRRSSPATASPVEDENLLPEILLRLPPEPSSLPRASLVCRRWRSILSDPDFLKRFRRHHQKPPLLGFFRANSMSTEHQFIPVLDSPDRIPAARFSVPNNSNKHWNFIGCRHGLAILVNMWLRQVMVWDPLTGQQHRVACPPGLVFDPEVHLVYWEAAVMCADAEDGHVHGDCFSRPLKLVLIWVIGYRKAFACLYESASGLWGDIVSMESTDAMLGIRPGILVGSALCWVLCGGNVLVFDVQSQHLDLIKRPVDCPMNTTSYGFVQVLRMDDNRLGLAYLSKLTILLWERKSNCDGVVRWVFLQKSIQLEELFPHRMFSRSKKIIITGYDEDTNVIVLSTIGGVFMLQLYSMEIKRICKGGGLCLDNFHPYTNFYTTGALAGDSANLQM
uniref:F-box domain-containing protein n=2 Tax=Aegilops tauschii subsp. strangulata TaxID=200361 RepID=A0A453MPD4_AEGTS